MQSSILYSVTLKLGLFIAAIIAQPLEIDSLAFNVLDTYSTLKIFSINLYTAGILVAPPTISTECNCNFKF